MSELPPFSLTAPQFDLSTFIGRFTFFCNITNPLTLLTSDKDINESKKLLDLVRKCEEKRVDLADLKACAPVNDKLWHARGVVESTLHPTSGDVLPWPFRVSAIAPVNIPLVWGMLATPSSNVPVTLALHFINQSYNAGCNYFNRSGSDMSLQEMGISYSLAVGSACSMAFGLGKLFERGPKVLLARFGVLIPLISTAAASVSNLSFTRSGEVVHGIPLTDHEGQVRGNSKVAAVSAISQTAAGRCCLVPAATLLLPTAVLGILGKLKAVPKNKKMALFLELGIIYMALQAALPAALAVFPQTLTMDVDHLEEEFRHLTDSQGRAVRSLTGNKGL